MALEQTADPGTEPVSGARVRATIPIDDYPAELESAQSKLVFLALWTTGGSTVDELKKTLGLSKLTLLRVLETLTANGLVDRDGEQYVVVDR